MMLRADSRLGRFVHAMAATPSRPVRSDGAEYGLIAALAAEPPPAEEQQQVEDDESVPNTPGKPLGPPVNAGTATRTTGPRVDPEGSANRPATIRETLANREYQALFAASSVSWFGASAARAAVIALVYLQTGSPVASAAAFAISYLPWLGIGAVLSSITDRHSYRMVMILSDLVRMGIMAALAVFDGMPVSILIALLFVSALLSPSFDSARSSLLPRIVQNEQYATALMLQRAAGQVTLIAGYAVGAALTAVDARYALLLNACCFGVSALLVAGRVKKHTPSLNAGQHSHLIREAIEGFSVVFRSPVMRSIALVVFSGVTFGVVPEGLAAIWSVQLAGGPSATYLGAIVVSAAVGFVAGSLLMTWLVKPRYRVALIRPFAILTPLTLVPALFELNIYGVVAMTLISGAALSGILPATNALFVQVLPAAYRARAFGTMQAGVHIAQGGSILFTGWLASYYQLPDVVGLFAIAGVLTMALIAGLWPRPAMIASAIAVNQLDAAWEQLNTPSTGDTAEAGKVSIDLGRDRRRASETVTSAALWRYSNEGPFDLRSAATQSHDHMPREFAAVHAAQADEGGRW